MKFKLDFHFNCPSDFQLSHKGAILLLGSCFSDEMGNKFENAGFDCLSNPFGTLFHPIAILNSLENALDLNTDLRIKDFETHFSSWNTSTLVRASTRDEMEALYRKRLREVREKLLHAEYIFVTFGTAWGYELNDEGRIVANCHKQPSKDFTKELTEISTIVDSWKTLMRYMKTQNPKLKWVFTVSPVRHSKDGLIENNRSKSRLIEACHLLCNNESAYYFPSYEIIIDELRDYRFYKQDFVHPDQQAIDFVWERLSEEMMSETTRKLVKEVVGLKNQLAHRSIDPNSIEEKKRIQLLNDKILQLSERNPEIQW